MKYLLDTVTVVRHLTDIGHIGTKAIGILNAFDNNFLISVVSLMEIMYLSEKHRIEIDLTETLNKIESSSLYSVVDLTPEILKVAEITPFRELHDRLILSTAKWLEIPVISSDKTFDKVEGIEVIWN